MSSSTALPRPSAAPPSSPAAAYVQALRAFSFPASVVPVLLGAALAARGYFTPDGRGAFSPAVFALTLVGALLAHAGGNVLNDHFDYVRGVDTRPEHGSGVLTQGLLTPAQTALFGTLLMGGALLCGVGVMLLAPASTATVLLLALLGAACAFLYPSLLKRYALGDVLIVLSFGLGLTLGAYGVQVPLRSGAQVGGVLLAALPTSLLIDAILHANNIRDAADDGRAGVRTLATLLGPRGAQALQAVLLFAPLALGALGAALRLLPWASLAVLLSAPLLVKAYRTGDVPFVAQSHLVFGVLYALAVWVFPAP
jgi:1,4-dihydroxy-2-naphthoate octaprenyltransferase